jgi:hypothetical protein
MEEEEEEEEEREEDQQLRNQANLLVAWCLQRWPGSSDIEPLASWVYSLSKGVKRVVDQEDGERVLGVCKGVVRTLLSGESFPPLLVSIKAWISGHATDLLKTQAGRDWKHCTSGRFGD